ncbi:MAG TPA: dynamin family protein [Candidatus Ozemobacteraceae bacterium]|nr:dynamin family protein [Candidatus Ozemobacteraceae bacterium]
MSMALALTRLLKEFPALRPELHEFVLPGRVTGFDAADAEGVFLVHPGGIALAQAPRMLGEGFAVSATCREIALVRLTPAAFEVHLVRPEGIRTARFVPADHLDHGQLAAAALLIQLRLADVVKPWSPRPLLPLPDADPESAARGAAILAELCASFPAQPLLLAWRAALLIAAGAPDEAVTALTAGGRVTAPAAGFMLVVALICNGKYSLARPLIADYIEAFPGSPDLRRRLLLVCRIQGARRERDWPGRLELLALAPALRDVCLEPAWPSLRRILAAPGCATLETVAALLEENDDGLARLLERARGEAWPDPLPLLLVEASRLARDGDVRAAFLRLWPARGPACFAPLLSLALAGGTERLFRSWIDTKPEPSEGIASEERVRLAHVYLRTGSPESAAALLASLTEEYRAALSPDATFRLTLIEALLDKDPRKERVARLFSSCSGQESFEAHPEAPRFEAEMRIALATADAGLDHHRDARAGLIRAAALLDVDPDDPLQRMIADARTRLVNDHAPSTWGELAGIVRNLVLNASEARRAELSKRWSRIEQTAAFPLTIACIGEFNAGKSSLLNALIGRNLLPVGVLPTTCLPCGIEDADQVTLVVQTHHGTILPRPPADLERLLREPARSSERPSATDAPAMLHLFAPLPALKHLRLLDLPGLNARIARHQTFSEASLEGADIILWIDTASQFSSASNAASRTRLVRPWQMIIPVLNRIDEVEPAERDEVIRSWNAAVDACSAKERFVTSCVTAPGVGELVAWLTGLAADAAHQRHARRKSRLAAFLKSLEEDLQDTLDRMTQAVHAEEPGRPPAHHRIDETTVRSVLTALGRAMEEWRFLPIPPGAFPGLVGRSIARRLEAELPGFQAAGDGFVPPVELIELAGVLANGHEPGVELVARVCESLALDGYREAMKRWRFDQARRRSASRAKLAEIAVLRALRLAPLLELINRVHADGIPDLPWSKNSL